MGIQVRLADGTTLEFPDGTADSVIDNTVAVHIQGQRARETMDAQQRGRPPAPPGWSGRIENVSEVSTARTGQPDAREPAPMQVAPRDNGEAPAFRADPDPIATRRRNRETELRSNIEIGASPRRPNETPQEYDRRRMQGVDSQRQLEEGAADPMVALEREDPEGFSVASLALQLRGSQSGRNFPGLIRRREGGRRVDTEGEFLSPEAIASIVRDRRGEIEGMEPREALEYLFGTPEQTEARRRRPTGRGETTASLTDNFERANAPSEIERVGPSLLDIREQQAVRHAALEIARSRRQREQEGYYDGVAGFLRGTGEGLAGGINRGVGGIARSVGDTLGADWLSEFGQRVARGGSIQQQLGNPGYEEGSIPYHLYNGVQGVGQIAVALGVGMTTRNPNLAASMVMGAQVYGDRYDQSRNEGRSPGEAMIDASAYALMELIPEKMALDRIMRPGGRFGSSFIARVARGSAIEAVQEDLTESMQILYDAGVINENMSWGDVKRRLIDSGVAGAIGGGTLAAGVHAAGVRDEEEQRSAPQPEISPAEMDQGVIAEKFEGESELTPEDRASPLPDAIIARGRSRMRQATVTPRTTPINEGNQPERFNVQGWTVGDGYGARRGGGRRTHQGVDIFADTGTPFPVGQPFRILESHTQTSGSRAGGNMARVRFADGSEWFAMHLPDLPRPGEYAAGSGVLRSGTSGFNPNSGTGAHIHWQPANDTARTIYNQGRHETANYLTGGASPAQGGAPSTGGVSPEGPAQDTQTAEEFVNSVLGTGGQMSPEAQAFAAEATGQTRGPDLDPATLPQAPAPTPGTPLPPPLPMEGAQPVASPVAAPAPVQPLQTPSAPVQQPAPSSTGLTELGSGMAAGISENMRDMLLAKLDANDLTENGAPSTILQVMSLIRARGGTVDATTAPAITQAYGSINSTGPQRQADLNAVVNQFAPPAPVAPQFDPETALPQLREYVAGRGPLDLPTIAKRLGVSEQDAARVVSALTSRPDSGVYINGGGKLRRKAVARSPVDAIRFLRNMGGIRDDAGHDLIKGRNWNTQAPGLISRNGRSIDEAGEALMEAGYFPNRDAFDRPTEAEVLEFIENAFSTKAYSQDDLEEVQRREAAGESSKARDNAEYAVREYVSDRDLPLTLDEMDDAIDYLAAGGTVEAAVERVVEEASRRGLYEGADDTGNDFYETLAETIYVGEIAEQRGDGGPEEAGVGPEGLAADAGQREAAGVDSGQAEEVEIGTDAGNGYVHAPNGWRISVGDSSFGVSLQKRKEGAKPQSFFVGVDGNLIDGDTIDLTNSANTERLWKVGTEEERAEVATLLRKIGLDDSLNGPEKKAAKARIREIVTKANETRAGVALEPEAEVGPPGNLDTGSAATRPQPEDMFGEREGDQRTALERQGEGRLKADKRQKAPGEDGGLFDTRETTGDLLSAPAKPSNVDTWRAAYDNALAIAPYPAQTDTRGYWASGYSDAKLGNAPHLPSSSPNQPHKARRGQEDLFNAYEEGRAAAEGRSAPVTQPESSEPTRSESPVKPGQPVPQRKADAKNPNPYVVNGQRVRFTERVGYLETDRDYIVENATKKGAYFKNADQDSGSSLQNYEMQGALRRGVMQRVEAAPAVEPEAPRNQSDSNFGANNKIVSVDRAAELRAKIKAKISGAQLNAGIDPELLAMGAELAAFYIEGGVRKFADFAKRLAADLELSMAELRPFLRGWYNGARDTLEDMGQSIDDMDLPDAVRAELAKIDKETPNAPDSRQPVERDSGRAAAEDGVRQEALPADAGEAGRGARIGDDATEGAGRDGPARSDEPAGDRAAPVGERGDSGVRGGSPGASVEPSERGGAERGRDDGERGQPVEHVPTGAVARVASDAPSVEAKRAAQAAANSIAIAPGDIGNIRATLPYLKPTQQDDVYTVERRFAAADDGDVGPGMLLTNGTGTGKTFVGAGVAARAYRDGRAEQLILVPSDDIGKSWEAALGELGVPAHILASTQDAGKGVSITTYANFYQNDALADRDFDLVIPDEAQKLSANKQGEVTSALKQFRAITRHPKGTYDLAKARLRKKWAPFDAIRARWEAMPKKTRPGNWGALMSDRQTDALNEVEAETKALAEKLAGAPRAKALFLSATPWSYVESVDWAEGYLFSYDTAEPGTTKAGYGYNQPDPMQQFFITHFGYRMRNNKLTKPEAEVDSGVMEREFHEWLKREGALSGRVLDVDADYDRKFVLVDDAVGKQIDQALDFLSAADDGKFRPLYDLVSKKFDYLSRMRLLEAIKAKHAIPMIEAYHKAGKKVVVFHDYNEGGGFSPFNFAFDADYTINVARNNQIVEVNMNDLNKEFRARNPYVEKLDFSKFPAPLVTLQRAFPDAIIYNGTVPNKKRRAGKDAFNVDGGANLIIIQSAAGEYGISVHDTTGKHQRVSINLGMPVRPTTAIQEEGRTRREGSVSDALYRYLNTGTAWERWTFAGKIAERSSTAENLALGNQARHLKQSFIDAFADAAPFEMTAEDGKGGKEADQAANTMTPFQQSKTFYWAQQKKSGRRDQREGVDYFATPEPVGYKMVEWANAKFGERTLEPSAGHGAIARFLPESTDRTIVEPSADLLSRAALASPGARTQNIRFEDLNILNKFDAIVMNPPFGMGGKTAIEHVEKAYRHLRNGGRIVALIPEGPAADKRFDAFMEGETAKGLHQVSSISLPASTFGRAGTQVRTRIVVLEKQTDADVAARIQSSTRDLSDVGDINALFDRIEDMGVPDRLAPKTEDFAPALTYSQIELARAAPGEVVYSSKPTFDLGETVHAKTGEDLFVATQTERVERAQFDAILAIAKKHGGYYSSYRAMGAIPGYQFKTAASREAFVNEAGIARDSVQEPKFSISDEPGPDNRMGRYADGSSYAQREGWLADDVAQRMEWDAIEDKEKARLEASGGRFVTTDEARRQRYEQGPAVTSGMTLDMQVSAASGALGSREAVRRWTVRESDEYVTTLDPGKGNPSEPRDIITIDLMEAMRTGITRVVKEDAPKAKTFSDAEGGLDLEASQPTRGLIERRGPRTDERQGSLFSITDRDGVGFNDKIVEALNAEMRRLSLGDKIVLETVRTLYDNPKISGQYLNGIVTLALENPQKPTLTLNHEAVHALRDLGLFKPDEWRALEKAALANGKLMGSVRRRYADYGLTEDQLVEEGVADMYAAWRQGRLETGFVRAALQRITSFFKAIHQAITKTGMQDEIRAEAERIMRAIEGGTVGSRNQGVRYPIPGPNGISGPAFAAAEPTESAAFKRWFGDSKVVDADGAPQVVYHGGADWTSLPQGQPTWFTDHEVVADGYADQGFREPRISAVYLKIENPLDLRDSETAARYGASVDPGVRTPGTDILDAGTVKRLIAEGYDGAIHYDTNVRGTGRHTSYVVFGLGAQAKSAGFNLGEQDSIYTAATMTPANRGSFEPNDNRIMYSVADNEEGSPETRWLLSEGTVDSINEKLDTWRTRLQDRMLPLLRTQQRIEAQSGQLLPEGANPYLSEELMSGKVGARLDRLTREMVEPLMGEMKTGNITPDELETFLYARHAPERNARIAEINPAFEDGGGSGMTDEEAAEIMEAAEAEGKTEALESLANRIDAILRFGMAVRVESGLLSKEEAEVWLNRYEHYVPLRGIAEVDPGINAERAAYGSGINVRGPESRRAFGRRSRAKNILAYTLLQAEEAIVRAGTNEVGKSFYNLALANPDSNFWTVDKITRKPTLDKETGQIFYTHSNRLAAEDAPYTVSLKIDGQEHRVTMNRNNLAAVKLATAMRNLHGTQLGGVLRIFAGINRYLSAVNTTYNPEFVLTNAARDIQTAGVNLSSTDIKGITRGVMKDYKSALKAASWETRKTLRKGGNLVRKHILGTEAKEMTPGEWDHWHRDFLDQGGRVYFNKIEDLNELQAKIEKTFKRDLRRRSGGAGAAMEIGRAGASSVFQFFENVNLGVENALRLSVYKNAVERGVSKAKAASIAKNITVNFNRRGDWGTAANALYLFFNASVQGTARMLSAIRHKRVRRILGAVVVSAFALDMFNALVSDDDDDGESFYDKISEYEKSRNLIIMIPGGHGRYIKIPLPYGYNVFAGLGRSASEIARGHNALESASHLVGTAVDSFNPVGGTNSLLNFIAPTVADPLVDLSRNRDFADRPIMPERREHGPQEPESQRYWGSVSPHWRAVTDTLNSATGGDEVVPGAVDVSPEVLEHLGGVFMGSAGSFWTDRVGGFIEKVVAGESIDANDIPFVRRVVGSPPQWYNRSAFYDRAAEVEQAAANVESYREKGQDEVAEAYAERNAALIDLSGSVRSARRQLRLIRRSRGELDQRQRAGDIESSDYREQRRALDEQEAEVVSGFNGEYVASILRPR